MANYLQTRRKTWYDHIDALLVDNLPGLRHTPGFEHTQKGAHVLRFDPASILHISRYNPVVHRRNCTRLLPRFRIWCDINFFIASFFWMNVMCIDMWLAFSGIRGFAGQRNAEKKRFLLYCLYACGMPTLHVLLVLMLNHLGDETKTYYPGIGKKKMFSGRIIIQRMISIDGIPSLLYFYGPMAVLIAVNVVLFVLTAVKIQKVKKETSMLKHSDNKRHSYEDDKQKFNLYLKLMFAMGVNWSMEVISWAFIWKMGTQVPTYIWYLTDFCNALYGVFIFFIFVFKKKIWRNLKKRYYLFAGKPHLAHSLTTTQTTRSISTADTMVNNDHRLSEFKNGREERPLTQN
ncbi:hypothetical protein NQ317_014128 [Molorchus minor]|uniref:G-protein coupled receptors family 2 profile 2 domain-containing protein n=1 Tax=Molorchus minor TaxID=1323400 RepID=A0ABQ9IVF6_9CUCU|nr:hypothetical protein NQ317_014128 [Molorchus minor]